MNILLVTGRIPYPLYYGSTVRVYHPFRILSRTHNVFLFCLIDDQDQLEYLPEVQSIFTSISYLGKETEERRSLNGRLLNILSMNPNYIIEKQYPEHFKTITNKLDQIISENKIDIVHTHLLGMAQFTNKLHKVSKVLDLVDSETLFLKRDLQQKSFSFSKAFIREGIDFARTMVWEAKIPKLHDATILVSPKDAEVISRLCSNARIKVIPNGVDVSYFSPEKKAHVVENSVIFHGHMSYPPNVDAVLFFYKSILPLIRKEIPGLKMFIVGKNPSDEIRRLSMDNAVIVTGFVEDIRPFITQSSVCVFPLRAGGGFRNKIAEAMAMGKPVVASSMGVEGLTVFPENNIMIADDPGQFSEKILELLRNKELRDRMGCAAREFVVRRYSWEIITKSYEKLYERIVRNFNRNQYNIQRIGL